MKDNRKYQILKTIATGGTAVLYKAIQSSLDRPVVIKRLHSHLTSDPNFTRRFELEAKAAASFDHENIVRIIDFGSTDGNHYIVMEYIDGLSLKELLELRGPLSEECALLIAHEVCMGLDHAHQRGIIHRDVKPANIMITNEGQVKITDFGLAKLHQSQTQQTVADTLLGTPLYMSPEQAIGDSIDGRSDLFSLATVLYEMLTGAQPFRGDTYAAVIENILHRTVPSPSRLGRTITREAEAIVMKAINREPSRRYRTALEMARAIESLLGQETVLGVRDHLRRLQSGDEDLADDGPPRARARSARRAWPLLVSSGVVVAFVALLALFPNRYEAIRMRLGALRAPHPAPATLDDPFAEALQGSPIALGVPSLSRADPRASASDSIGAAPAGAPVDRATSGGAAVIVPSDGAAADSVPAADPGGVAADDRREGPGETAVSEGTSIGGGGDGAPSVAAKPPAADEKPSITPGYLSIAVDPDAEILVDGVLRRSGSALGPVELTSGKHEIVCRKDGYHEYREVLHITKGELSRRGIILERITGAVNFVTDRGAQVFIDGAYRGTTPLAGPLSVTAGTHRIELKKLGFKQWSSDVYVPGSETLQMRISLVPL